MRVRQAHLCDWLAIEALTRRAHCVSPDFWPWEEYLTDECFFVVEQSRQIVGALCAASDESPVAWVRLAAVEDTLDLERWLTLSLPPTLEELHRQGIQALAWMDYQSWAGAGLSSHGFSVLTEVITLSKSDRDVPDVNPPNIDLRPVSGEDIPSVVAVDRAAFTPHWWHSEDAMRRRSAESSHFVVATLAGEIVGYAEGKLHLPEGHLNRIAVHPARQGCGIGASLLLDMLRAFWHKGAERVSLNTQGDNYRSLHLYRRFGFKPTGDTVTVWELRL